MRRIPAGPSVLTLTSSTPSTVLSAAGDAIHTRLAGLSGGTVVVVGGVVDGGPVVDVVVDNGGGGAVVVVVDDGGGGAEGALGSPGGEVGPGWPWPCSVEKGLI